MFFDFSPSGFESCKEGRKKRSHAFLKIKKIEAESIYVIQR